MAFSFGCDVGLARRLIGVDFPLPDFFFNFRFFFPFLAFADLPTLRAADLPLIALAFKRSFTASGVTREPFSETELSSSATDATEAGVMMSRISVTESTVLMDLARLDFDRLGTTSLLD